MALMTGENCRLVAGIRNGSRTLEQTRASLSKNQLEESRYNLVTSVPRTDSHQS